MVGKLHCGVKGACAWPILPNSEVSSLDYVDELVANGTEL